MEIDLTTRPGVRKAGLLSQLCNFNKRKGRFSPRTDRKMRESTRLVKKKARVDFRMVKDVYYGKTLRQSFARYEEILDMPNLLEVQKESYQWFLDTGLREVFKDVDSITDYAEATWSCPSSATPWTRSPSTT